MANIEIVIDSDEVLEQLDTEYIVSYFGAGDLLDEIGKQEAMDQFGLVEIK